MIKSTRSPANGKPKKPRPDFPLFPHATRRWAKKIRGKLHYFGPWDDPDGALAKYLDQKDDLHAGRTSRPATGAVLVRDVLNHFLTAKKLLVDSGEITPRTWVDYHATCERIAEAFGRTRRADDVRADDFAAYRAAVAKKWGPVPLGNEIQRVRSMFKHAYDARLVSQPVHFGAGFKRPSRKVLRKARYAKGPRMFEAAELLRVLDAIDRPLKAMVLLGINCGFGNTDVATLPQSALNLETGWADYPRPKTGIPRRCPLWPETGEALRDTLAHRPAPKDPADAGLVFVTKYGRRWFKDDTDNPISKELAKVLKELGIHRKGLNFYALRHTFETIGGEAKDQVAVDFLMGHARDDMASVYRERLGDDRLRAVVEHVRQWLYGTATMNATGPVG